MKNGFYSKIALTNIRKNYRFFIPRILTSAGLLGCFYIMRTLTLDERLSQIKGGAYLPTIMGLGCAVLAILSVILILYTNSFLMKQRKGEFGMYNVLGMEKRHIGRILFFESFFSTICATVLGLVFGMLFYKVCSLLICKLLESDIVFGFYFIQLKPILQSALFFIAIDIFAYVINLINIKILNPIELLKSVKTGEREPRVKWLMLIIGIITLGIGYYIAITTESPLKAIFLFFVAVVLVIIGTYCLFVTGSVWVLKLLKNNKRYYYNKKHMTAVSGLLFRMKQNAVGLASIAILATGVLVMISTTISLYVGAEQSLDRYYPQQLYIEARYETKNKENKLVPSDEIIKIVNKTASDNGQVVKEIDEQEFFDIIAIYNGSEIVINNGVDNIENSMKKIHIFFITQQQYNEFSSNKIQLNDKEICIHKFNIKDNVPCDEKGNINAFGNSLVIKSEIKDYPFDSRDIISDNVFGFVVADNNVIDEIYTSQLKEYEKCTGESPYKYTNRIAVLFSDTKKACENGEKITQQIETALREYIESQSDFLADGDFLIGIDSLWETKEYFYGMYGSLLFLGILLGLVFLFATALIIYFKQISEGYEDRYRFQIMQKIGMSNEEVRKTIKNQIVLIFLLPLIVAGIHIIFAFPLLEKLLHIMLLSSTMLFIICTAAVFVVFSIIYLFIYARTAKTYYKIVH